MRELYAIIALEGEGPGQYQITKFDADVNVVVDREGRESIYAVSTHGCECPRGHKASCRHREMLVLFLSDGHIGDGWLFDWHSRLWLAPVGDALAASEELQSLPDDESAGPPEDKVVLPSQPKSSGGGMGRRSLS